MADEPRWDSVWISVDDAKREFFSEKDLHLSVSHERPADGDVPSASGKSPQIQTSTDEPADLEIVYLTNVGADEFLSEKEEPAVFTPSAPAAVSFHPEGNAPGAALDPSHNPEVLTIAKLRPNRSLQIGGEPSGLPECITVASRTWATTRTVRAGLAASTMLGFVLVFRVGSWSADRAPTNMTTVGAADRASVASPPTGGSSATVIEFGGASDQPGAVVVVPPVHRLDDGGGVVSSTADDPAQLSRMAPRPTAPSTVATFVNATGTQRPQRQQASAMMRESRADGLAAPLPDPGAELPSILQARAGESVAFVAAVPSTFGSAVGPPDSTPTATAGDGGEGLVSLSSRSAETVEAGFASVNTAPVRELLTGYQTAYERLDARLAKQIWPGVDERALARAFDALESQTVTFETCNLSFGDDRAVASCRGSAAYVTRMGHRSSHTERRQWTFELQKSPDRWVIGSVQIR